MVRTTLRLFSFFFFLFVQLKITGTFSFSYRFTFTPQVYLESPIPQMYLFGPFKEPLGPRTLKPGTFFLNLAIIQINA